MVGVIYYILLGVVYDAMTVYRGSKQIDTWNEEERTTFKEK